MAPTDKHPRLANSERSHAAFFASPSLYLVRNPGVLSISILLSINHVSMFFSSICTFSLCLYKPATCSRRCSAESKSKDNMPLSCATRSTHGINDISNLLYKAFRLNISLHAFSKSKAFSSSFFFSSMALQSYR